MIIANLINANDHDGPAFSEHGRASATRASATRASATRSPAGGGAKVDPTSSTGATPANEKVSFLAQYKDIMMTWVKAFVWLGVYVMLAILVYGKLEPDWTPVDCFYFGMMTMSTVGYGDLSPSSDGSRGFTIFMIFFGIICVFTAFCDAIGLLTGPVTSKGRDLMEKLFPQVAVDLNGDGGIDYYKPRPPVIYYSKNMLPSLALIVTVQCVSAAIFTQVTGNPDDPENDPQWTFGLALYHCFVTATTVGYGDCQNSSQAGRLWASFHMLLAVALLGEIISTLGELSEKRAATLKRVECLERQLDEQLLEDLIARAASMRPLVKRDGKGLTELEFVLAMCVELEVVQWDQVQPFIKQFRMLDVNGDARLGRDDLAMMVGKTRKEIKAMSDGLGPGVEMSVADRMGLSYMGGDGRADAQGGEADAGQVRGGRVGPLTYTDQAEIPLGDLSIEMIEALIGRAQAVVEAKREQANLLGRAQAAAEMAEAAAAPQYQSSSNQADRIARARASKAGGQKGMPPAALAAPPAMAYAVADESASSAEAVADEEWGVESEFHSVGGNIRSTDDDDSPPSPGGGGSVEAMEGGEEGGQGRRHNRRQRRTQSGHV